jgi:hypothetical protein
MIYFIVTACLLQKDYSIREKQYINSISKLKELTSIALDKDKYEIIIVENNGFRKTFLDNLGLTVNYTNNNNLRVKNKGYKELQDVFDSIEKFKISDSDFIVKITGRYLLKDDNCFINALKNTNYDCIIRYGSYMNPVKNKMLDCITGLIGMRCFYVKQIEYPNENECVEWKWAKATYLINDEKINNLDNLGIYICPSSNTYFLV